MTLAEFKEKTGMSEVFSEEYRLSRVYPKYQAVFDSPLLGKVPDYEIARIFGVSRRDATRMRNKKGILPPQASYISQEGLYLRSSLEAMYDAYLHELGIDHEHEPMIIPNDRHRGDFKIKNLFIEIKGMGKFKNYDDNQNLKAGIYKDNNLKVVWLLPEAVIDMYKNCKSVSLVFTDKKQCKECGAYDSRINFGMCFKCYSEQRLFPCQCASCGKEFMSNNRHKKYCGKSSRDCSLVIVQGKETTLIEALKSSKVSRKLYSVRVFKGWTQERAILTPPQKKTKSKYS